MKSCFTGRHLPAVGQRRRWLVTMSEVMTMALPLEMVVSSTHLIVSLNLHVATCRIVSNDLHEFSIMAAITLLLAAKVITEIHLI